ncbi:pentapeptide repeat-containing protein [Runella rosea]|uniref:Pentapeptide repeat-containing protein n=1 Tax=Runella rosea TaxID=2259595 RepID=A0A344TRZ7_9BACT|nr:pentapeptide repeat-containing protein [Runella rosea]AXE21418.1 pentapeptide repeat-containing protein [Runella rosea]
MKRLSLFLLAAFSATALYAQKQVSAREVFQAIDKHQSVQYDGVVVTGDLDFTELSNRKIKKEKGWEEIKTTVEVPVVFRNCTFKGDVIAYKRLEENGSRTKIFNIEVNGDGGTTYSADFRENAVFENCTFENGSEFKYSTFSKVANFAGSKFAEQANFKYARFRQDALYTNIRFEDYANFKYADFSRRADFQEVRFRDYADFKYAEFEEKVNFAGSRFQRNADFKYADFNAGASFDKADFDGSVDFKYSNGKRYVSR